MALAQSVLRKRYLLYIRALLSLAIILIACYNYDAIIKTPVLPVIYLFLVIVSNFVFMLLPNEKYKGIKLHYIIFLLDILLIVIGAVIFKCMDIAFTLAIFLTIFISALSQSVALSLIITIVVDVLYVYLRVVTSHGEITITDPQTLLNIPFIFIVAFHSSYLAEKANQELKEQHTLEKINIFLSKKVRNINEELSEIMSFTSDLCESFNEAVIVLDNDGVVRFFNKTAEKIFQVKAALVSNIALSEMTVLSEIKDTIMAVQFQGTETLDKEITVRIQDKEKNVVVNALFIKNNAGTKMGILCTAREAGV